MLTLANYQIGTPIYESANSIVYRGVRTEDNQPVILKVLKEDYPTPEELTRYRQEYEITNGLNLDGVVKTYSLEKYQNTLVIILEDFAGESLTATFDKEGLGGISVSDFLPIAIKIADALGQIHAANIIHKDINPANIVWSKKTNQLKIIDFSIASRLPRENTTLKNPEQLEGTLAYISPEQTGRMNRALDYRTDLYSLGVTFYELLTGKVPYEVSSPLELVHSHIAKNPLPVCKINPNVPPIISSLVMKLMAKNVEDRYQSAFGVKADLEKCLENLESFENLIDLNFELAQNDFSGKLQIPQKLYGRENEIDTLLQAFERVSFGASEMMLIAGYSGVGKTALVHEVHKPMTEKNGYFAAGKFDQYQRNIPYSALSKAFNEFCHYLLTESTQELNQWREKILNAVGNNGQVLIEVIGQLELVIGPQPAVAQVGATEAQNRFNLVFQNFFRAICQAEHPLVLFIDDLQWADSASLNLLNRLMTDREGGHFFLIGAYRDNEVDASHPLMIMLKKLTDSKTTINTIQLTNLLVSDVNILIAEALQCDSVEAYPLAQLVYEKTQGNAFFTGEFLNALLAQALLSFNWSNRKWQWQLDSIANKGMTDNVIVLMVSKIEQLCQKTIQMLKLAACIGNRFDLQTLSIIAQQSPQDTLSHLWTAIEQGVVLPLDDNYKQLETADNPNITARFKFQHDRVQQAAYALIDDDHKKAVHLQIGRLLLKNTSPKKLDEHLFSLVEQLNQGLELINNPDERNKMARLNLMAGQKAKLATAYEAAIKYLTFGMDCLPENGWKTEYDLTFNLYVEAVEAEYINGRHEQASQLSNTVLQQTKILLDKVKVYKIQIPFYITQNRMQEALDTGLQVLEMLGISLLESPPEKWVVEELETKPEMTDPTQLAALKILVSFYAPTLITKPSLIPPVVFTMVHLCATGGNSPQAAFAYVFYGVVLCGMGHIESGYQFGKLALKVLEQFGAKNIKCKVHHLYNALIRHWNECVGNSIEALRDNIQVGLELGDIEFAGYSILDYCSNLFLKGELLEKVRQEHEQYIAKLQQNKQEYSLYYAKIWAQLVLNLSSETEDKFCLNGRLFNETSLPLLQEANNFTPLFCVYLGKSMLSYWFKDYKGAVANAIQAEQYQQSMATLMPVAQHPFYYSLALLARYSMATCCEQAEYMEKVAINQQKIALWAHNAPMNFQHKYDLVEAEKAKVLGQMVEAEMRYEKAIAGAKQNEYRHEEALAYELAAEFYLARSMTKIAQTYLRDAHYAYQQWGALTKVKDLEDRYPQCIASTNTIPIQGTVMEGTIMASVTRRAPTSYNLNSTWLDLDSVIKAAQTLSGEIVLSRLLEKMMHIVIENAGAEKGFLLLPQQEQWVIEAEGLVSSDEVKVLQSLPVNNQEVAESIIHYVARTKANVVLNNASKEGQFIRDTYIVSQQPKSILCTALINQGKLIGLLYLENNLTIGAFTPKRLELLQVLSSQIAISIENALLYKTLEQKVEERTAQLAQRTEQLAEANEEITVLNEQLTEENLRMSAELDISHRLQKMLLPTEKELQQIEGLDIAGFMEPAEEIGGDYYDVLYQEGRVLIGIGDVSGHGLESGALAIMVQSAIRTLLASYQKLDSLKFLSALNQMVYHNVIRMNAEKSLTLALLSYQQGQLVLTGQHEEVIVVRANGELEQIDTFDLGFPIGLDEEITDFIAEKQLTLQQGEVMVLYTDGITEAENIAGKFYGLERLCELVKHNWQRTVDEIRQTVIDDVYQFIGEQKVFDDITLLVIKQQ